MTQATSQNNDQFQEDPSLSEDQTQGKTSLFGKLKNKTKDQTHKLKTKLKSSTKTGEDATNEDSSPSSGEEETENPVNNAESTVSQSGYAEESSDGKFVSQDEDDQTEANAEDSGLSKDFEGLSTNDKSESVETHPSASASADEPDSSRPMTETIEENAKSAKDKAQEELTPPLGGNSEQKYASPDAPVVSNQAQQVGDKATETGKSWTQWAAEKVGFAKDIAVEKVGAAKDTVAANAPTTAEGKPYHEEAMGAAVGAKDVVAEKATAAKDSLAAQLPDQSSIPSDPAQQTYVQRATDGLYGAKDKLFTSTQPGEHDKALSQKVTETVGNLPATLKSSLGFGGKTGGSSSPTTTPASTDAPVSSPSEETPGAPPQSPGLVSRITGLFGGKKQATESSSPSSEPAISEVGTGTVTEVSESANMS